MPEYRSSIVWALSPLAFEFAGVVMTGVGVALVKRWQVAGAVLIATGLVIWVSGFYRIRRHRS